MKALLLAPELFAGEGGITRMLRLYLKAMCELPGDVMVDFVALNDSMVDTTDLRRYANANLADWVACNRKKVSFCRSALRIGRRADMIVCGHVAQLPVAWAASLLNPKLSYYLVAHGIEVWRPFTFLERRAILGAKRILCVSEYTRQQVIKHARIRPEKAVVLPNSLDPYLDPPAAMPLPDGPPVILSISRLTVGDNYKGINHLVSAMPAVREKIPGARLRVVGRGDGLPSLQTLARKLNMPDAVEFAGFRSDAELRDEFGACRLFALPSHKEGFGLVYLEAMAHGRPCLGANAGGVVDVITPETGLLVEYGDIPAIAAGIVASLQRTWSQEALLERAQTFSYPRFRDRFTALVT